MPDTKDGRERNGRNKRSQLESRLNRREIDSLDDDEDLPPFDGGDSEFVAEEPLADD